jgi:hypothetical protein
LLEVEQLLDPQKLGQVSEVNISEVPRNIL